MIQRTLSSRSQSVVLDGAESNPLPVVSGVPQGSILGPSLFLIYIDKVASLNRSSNIILYADDIALYLAIKEQSDYSQLQEDATSLMGHRKSPETKCFQVLLLDILKDKVSFVP